MKSAKHKSSKKPGPNRSLKARLRQGANKGVKKIVAVTLRLLALIVIVPVVLIILYSFSYFEPSSTLMAWRSITGNSVERQWVGLDEINPVLIHSVMMSEDARFCAHSGVDWQAVGQVIEEARDGEKPRGASTLSMQVVKNLFLWPGRSFIRKGLELPLALLADAVWGKKRMIEIYLNVAEWGEGVFGIEVAARKYFGVSADRLSARQSALLAVTLPNPKRRNPARATNNLSRLARNVERRAFQSGAYVKCIK